MNHELATGAAPSRLDWAPELIEAYARAGRIEDAERLLVAFEADVAERRKWAADTVERCRAALVDAVDADERRSS